MSKGTSIRVYGGLKANVPSNINARELMLATDTHELFHGNASGVPYQIEDLRKVSMITAGKTITVKTSGGDYTTLAGALAYAATLWICSPAYLTIEIWDGTYTNTAVNFSHPQGERIKIKGKNTYTFTLYGVTSTTWSSDHYNTVLQFAASDFSTVAVNDYLTLYDTSAGTNPISVCGTHKITAVDYANNTLTIDLYIGNGVFVPSGNVTTANAKVQKTILSGDNTSPIIKFDNTCLYGIYDICFVQTGVSLQCIIQNNTFVTEYSNCSFVRGLRALHFTGDIGALYFVGLFMSFSRQTIPIQIFGSSFIIVTYTDLNTRCKTVFHMSGYGWYASINSYAQWHSSSIVNNQVTTIASPAVNTVGNNNAYFYQF